MKSVRFLILAYFVLASCVHYINRTTINMSIFAMIKSEPEGATSDQVAINNSSVNSTKNEGNVTALRGDNSSTEVQPVESSPWWMDDERQDWDSSVQGMILSAFFWSYLAAQIPARSIGIILGNKWLICVTFILTANISLITPFLAHLPAPFIIISRFILGICQGFAYPPMWAILTAWMPVKDRSFAFSCLSAGATGGSVIAFFTSGLLIESYGWQFMFYSAGILAIFTSIAAFFVSDEPEQCKIITPTECFLILDTRQAKAATDSNLTSVPYLKILRSPVILSTMLFKFAITWIQMIFYTKLPAYLKEMTTLNFVGNGAVNAAGNCAYLVTLLLLGPVSEKIISSGRMSRTRCRKTFSLVTATGQAILVALIPFATGSIEMVIGTILLASFLSGFTSASDVSLASEQSNEHSVTLYTIYNISSMSCGMIAPNIIGIIQTWFAPQVAWAIVFYSTAALLVLSNVIFIIFASAEVQDFD